MNWAPQVCVTVGCGMSIFRTETLPAYSRLKLSIVFSITLHGPHHLAVTSTTTGVPVFSAAVTSLGVALGSVSPGKAASRPVAPKESWIAVKSGCEGHACKGSVR